MSPVMSSTVPGWAPPATGKTIVSAQRHDARPARPTGWPSRPGPRPGRLRARFCLLAALALLLGVPAAAQAQAPQLTGLSLSAGGSAIVFSPAFAAGTRNYTAFVPDGAFQMSVTPT